MSAILLFAAKRALIDALKNSIGSDTIQVEYAFPANPERALVYGGNARMTRQQALAEWGSAATETCIVDLWLRVASVESDQRAAEQQCETFAGAVLDALIAKPQIGTGLTFNDVTSASAPNPIVQGNPDPMIIVTLLMQVSVRGVLLP